MSFVMWPAVIERATRVLGWTCPAQLPRVAAGIKVPGVIDSHRKLVWPAGTASSRALLHRT